MENVNINVVYKHILHIEQRLNNLEEILNLPKAKVSAAKIKKYQKTLKAMMEGKEGTSWADYKRSRS